MRFTIALSLFLTSLAMAAPAIDSATNAVTKRDACEDTCETNCLADNTSVEAVNECYDACVLLEC